ncbi:MAG TPA: S8 family serine peptidase [Thermomicrobiales bacterium]|jgi:subtilisin family serine protease|nr:S8 family serine peptidase [Thermomicrobiales bacterium]
MTMTCRTALAWLLAAALSAGILPGAVSSTVTAETARQDAAVAFDNDDDDDDGGSGGDDDDDDWDDDDVPVPVPTAPVDGAPAPAPTSPGDTAPVSSRAPVVVPTITPIVGSSDEDDDVGNDDDGQDDADDSDPVPAVIEPEDDLDDDDDDDDIDDLDVPIADRAIVGFAAGSDPRDIAERSGTELLRVVAGIDIALFGLDPERPDPDELADLTADPDVVWGELNFTQQAPEGRPRYFFTSTASEPRIVDAPALPDGIDWDPAPGCLDGAGVTVAVLDTGIDLDHPMFEGRIAPLGLNVIDPTAGIDDVGNGVDDDDDGTVDEMVGHGTHVSGTILQVASGTMILPVTVLNSDGVGDTFTLTAGIVHALNAGADVINLSLGSTYDSRAIRDAIALATDRDVTVVAAAGNAARSQPLEYPASNDGVVSVAATTATGDRATFSNYNVAVDLSAPGIDVASAFPDGRYATASGTSMAAPIVTGTVALLLEADPDLTPTDAATLLAGASAPLNLSEPVAEGLLGAGIIAINATVGCD